jgi:hypothetical protein
MPPVFQWAQDHFDLRTFNVTEVPLEFTREAWRGRIRACRGIGASLSTAEIERFDADHRALLESIAPTTFTVLHQMTIHIYMRRGALSNA